MWTVGAPDAPLRIMTYRFSAKVLRTATLALLIVAPLRAFALTGTAILTGNRSLVVAGCGAHASHFASAQMLVREDGTWSISGDAGNLTGSYTPLGGSGRKVALTTDASSIANLVTTVETGASALCHAPATVTGTLPKAATLTLNKKLSKATLTVKYLFAGTARGRHGVAKLTVHGKGPWTTG